MIGKGPLQRKMLIDYQEMLEYFKGIKISQEPFIIFPYEDIIYMIPLNYL